MRILLFASDLSQFGGIQAYNINLIKAIEYHGDDVAVVQIYGITVQHKLSFLWRVFSKFISFRPQYIRCSHVHYAPIGFLFWILLRIPYEVSFYGVDVALSKTRVQRISLSHAHSIMLVFDWSVPIFLSQFPLLDNRIFLNPNPFNDSQFKAQSQSRALLEQFGIVGKRVILTVARRALSEQGNKGYYRVIQALPIVLQSIPDAVYVLAGGGDDLEYITNLIQHTGVADHVVLTGKVASSDLCDIYNLADVFVHPSRKEGFPIVCLEAMACGKTVIAGEYSEEPLLHGVLGISVDPLDINAIAHAIIRVLNREVKFEPAFIREKTIALYGFNAFNDRVGMHLDRLRRELICA